MAGFIGPYQLLRLVDRGGQGEVYLGYDSRLQRRVAIKVRELPAGRAARRRLLREARLAARLESPRIVQVYDVIESHTHLAIVMEYVPGCNLETLLAHRRLSMASILTIGIDIAGALAKSRQAGVIHGDVKAGNVLITRAGRAKLTDFGIARAMAAGAAPAAGSLTALSPEQYAGETVDTRSDLFALGALLYRMLSGEHPFLRGGRPDPALLLGGPPRLEERTLHELDVPLAVVEMVHRLLSRDPAQRPRNTLALRQVLRAALRDIPLAAQDSLSTEAAACFRAEHPEDIPLLAPPGLGRGARSRLPPQGPWPDRWRHWFRGLSPGGRAGVALAAVALAAAPAAWLVWGTATRVRFEQPAFSYTHAIRMPGAVSPDWLLAQVRLGLEQRLGRLEVVGPVGVLRRAVIASPTVPPPREPHADEHVAIALRCLEHFCVIDLRRGREQGRASAQGILFPDDTLEQWGDVVRSTAAALAGTPR